MLRLRGLLVLLDVLWAGAVSARDATVTIKSFHFAPMAVTVAAGDSVTWRNLDEEPHTVAGDDFRSGGLDTGGAFTFTFRKPGTYRYRCSIHPQMTGSVTVK